ncbi:MAG: hypothetical protein WKF75_03385 [Singulisphaera sp.]
MNRPWNTTGRRTGRGVLAVLDNDPNLPNFEVPNIGLADPTEAIRRATVWPCGRA